jgi:hypothetical protein
MSSKMEINRVLQELSEANEKLTLDRNALVVANLFLAERLVVAEHGHAARAARLQARLRRQRCPWWRVAWHRLVGLLFGRLIVRAHDELDGI